MIYSYKANERQQQHVILLSNIPDENVVRNTSLSMLYNY